MKSCRGDKPSRTTCARIHVSLNEIALAVLKRQLGKHPVRLFTDKGEPYDKVFTKAWQKALKRADIENRRWHELRHTWASGIAQKGVPLSDFPETGAGKPRQWCGGTRTLYRRTQPIGLNC